VDGYIAPVDATTIINECLNNGSDYFCGLFHRDPVSGVLFGTEGYLEANNQNTGYLQTSGMDFTSGYNFDLGNILPGAPDLGSIDISFVGTWLNSRRTEPLPDLGSYNCVGLFGPTCGQPTPKWRHNVRMTWTSPLRSTTVSANWRYFGSSKLSSNDFLLEDPNDYISINRRITGYSYLDLAATWKWVDSVEFRAGVNNVFDRDPPMIAAGLLNQFGNGNTYPGVYDPMGRLVYFGMTVDF
jgi:outer membrane receptor protein involved in Fe transport